MDIATIIGLVMAVGLIVGSMMMGTAPITAFIDAPSAMVVLGGAMGAVLMAFPLKKILSVPAVMKKVVFNQGEDVPALIEQLVSLAETARRDGLLALEGRLEEVDNLFIKLGIQMAVDGSRPEVIEDVMQTEIESIGLRHKTGKSILDQMGRFAPAYGMIGTLMGLIMMLSDMSDPSSIGSGMAVALITTMYGAIAANVVFMPFAEKLGYLSKQETISMDIILRGIIAIQSGENPRVIEQKLNTFLPPNLRPVSEEEAA